MEDEAATVFELQRMARGAESVADEAWSDVSGAVRGLDDAHGERSDRDVIAVGDQGHLRIGEALSPAVVQRRLRAVHCPAHLFNDGGCVHEVVVVRVRDKESIELVDAAPAQRRVDLTVAGSKPPDHEAGERGRVRKASTKMLVSPSVRCTLDVP